MENLSKFFSNNYLKFWFLIEKSSKDFKLKWNNPYRNITQRFSKYEHKPTLKNWESFPYAFLVGENDYENWQILFEKIK